MMWDRILDVGLVVLMLLIGIYSHHVGDELVRTQKDVDRLIGVAEAIMDRLERLESMEVDNKIPPPASPCVIYLRPGDYDADTLNAVVKSIECGDRVVMSANDPKPSPATHPTR